jgi:hypothetical protein
VNTAACDLPRKSLMRSGVIWIMVVSGVVLIGISLMHFSLTALREPGPVETRAAKAAEHFFIRLASRQEIPQRPVVDGVFWYRMGLLKFPAKQKSTQIVLLRRQIFSATVNFDESLCRQKRRTMMSVLLLGD